MAYGFGVVGCGMIARFHARAIEALPNAKLVAAFDRSQERVEKFAAEFGCRAYHDMDEFLRDAELQIVTVCTPSGAHLEPAVAAAEAGKHVVVEKPLEITLERCDKIINACDKAGVKLAAIFPSRFHSGPKALKEAAAAGRFGKLTLGDATVKWWRTQQYYDSGAWRGTWELDGGGCLMNQGIHSLDLLLWLMGPVREVAAFTDLLGHERIAVEDVAVAAVRFESGAVGVIEGSTATYPGYLKKIEISGLKGSAVVEEEDVIKWDFAEAAPGDAAILERMAARKSTGGGASDPSAIGFHGHRDIFAALLHSLDTGAPLEVDGREGRKAVELILAIYQSAETGQIVKLPLASDPVLAARAKK
ncbi:MAG TPA: Gfo/Idh/MocA family oxidoreductase [Pirellulales bacterium]